MMPTPKARLPCPSCSLPSIPAPRLTLTLPCLWGAPAPSSPSNSLGAGSTSELCRGHTAPGMGWGSGGPAQATEAQIPGGGGRPSLAPPPLAEEETEPSLKSFGRLGEASQGPREGHGTPKCTRASAGQHHPSPHTRFPPYRTPLSTPTSALGLLGSPTHQPRLLPLLSAPHRPHPRSGPAAPGAPEALWPQARAQVPSLQSVSLRERRQG